MKSQNQSLEFIPKQGLGPIRFGMSYKDAQKLLGKISLGDSVQYQRLLLPDAFDPEYRQSDLSKLSSKHSKQVDLYLKDRKTFGFASESVGFTGSLTFLKDKLIEVRCQALSRLVFEGKDLFQMSEKKLLGFLQKLDSEIVESAKTFYFKKLQIEVSREGSSDGRIVSFFRDGKKIQALKLAYFPFQKKFMTDSQFESWSGKLMDKWLDRMAKEDALRDKALLAKHRGYKKKWTKS